VISRTMHVVAVGLNHKTAPVALREAATVREEQAGELLRALVRTAASEAAVLSTCNRTELYLAAESHEAAEGAALRAFEKTGGDAVLAALYVKRNADAARHLFSVAAGLDSLVVGESQVLGQVRHALALAQEAGTAGPYLTQLFNQAVHVGKRVRAETPIGNGAASVSYAAVELARKVLGGLEGKRVLLVGAGKTAELAARSLAGRGVASVVVANRSTENAERLARRFGGRHAGLGELPALLESADIVIASTGARRAVISRADVAAAMLARSERPLVIIDIAMPRDVEERAGEVEGVFLYNIDDLKEVVDANLAERSRFAGEAGAIVEEEAFRFAAWMDERRAAPVIAALRRKVYEAAEAEVERLLRRLDHLPDEEKEKIRTLARSIPGKILHEPTVKIKESAAAGRRDELLQLVGELFNLDPRDLPVPGDG